MANGFGSLYVGAAGLQSSQVALNVTANNFANVNTTGYVRQQVIHTDRNYVTFNTTASISNQQSGLGVKIGDVVHARDVFLDKLYRTASGRQAFYAATYEAVEEVYTFYQELEGEAFQDSMEDFWTAFQELAKAPDDSINQNLVVQKAGLFISRAEAVYTGLQDYQSTINTQISDDIDRINELGETIHKLNLEIQKIEAGNLETAMSLRDERDNALDELSALASISYKEDVEGVVKVSLEGVTFVDEARYYEIGQLKDLKTGFVTPYWVHLSDQELEQYDEVFSFTTEISTELNTDIGEVKALLLARGDRVADYTDVEGLSSVEYNYSTADSIATGMSVMLSAQAQLDQLVHNIIVGINNILAPNTDASELIGDNEFAQLAGGNDYIIGKDAEGNEVKIYKDTALLDSANCATGADGKLPPQELFSRIGTERYTEVSVVVGQDANGDDITETYYVYNEEDETDSAKRYTLESVRVNEALVEQETKLPHLAQNGEVDCDLGEKLATLWDEEIVCLNPDDTNNLTFMDYYNNMIGSFGTLGSVYETTASNLSDSVLTADNQRAQVMGVSSDEELTKMIKYQNAYNASSRFINVVNEMIEHLVTQLGA